MLSYLLLDHTQRRMPVVKPWWRKVARVFLSSKHSMDQMMYL